MNTPIPITDAPVPFKPVCLGADSAIEFFVKPMTQAELAQCGNELFRHNIAPMSSDTFRAIIVDEIFNVYGDVEGETKANIMDEFWSDSDLYREQLDDWKFNEEQRLFDIANGAPHRAPDPAPQRLMSVRARSQAQIFAEDLRNKSQRVRDATVVMQTYAKRQAEGIVRLSLTGWTGMKTVFAKPNGIVPDEAWEALKAEIGAPAIAELQTFVSTLGALGPRDKGNSDSPLENGSNQSGLPEPSDESDSSDGSLTEPGITPIPSSESAPSTDSSSSSISDASGEILNDDKHPMVEG